MVSQTFVSEGISTMGVGNGSGTRDSVGDGMSVEVSVGVFVCVGDGVAVSGRGVEEGAVTVGVRGCAVNVDDARVGN